MVKYCIRLCKCYAMLCYVMFCNGLGCDEMVLLMLCIAMSRYDLLCQDMLVVIGTVHVNVSIYVRAYVCEVPRHRMFCYSMLCTAMICYHMSCHDKLCYLYV